MHFLQSLELFRKFNAFDITSLVLEIGGLTEKPTFFGFILTP